MRSERRALAGSAGSWHGRPIGRGSLLSLVALSLLLAIFAWTAPIARADEGWVVNSFDARIEILDDGRLRIVETVLVDFGSQRKHGIFRDIPVVYDYGEESNRVYDLDVESVTDANGRRHQYEVSREGSFARIKIGDPDVEVSGPQSYRITYRVAGALNAFADHDELYWNVNGEWPVRTLQTRATVVLPSDGVQRVACYQGSRGASDPCRATSNPREASFTATRPFDEGEQLTVVVGLRKGVVPEPEPRLEAKPREFADFFETTPATLGVTAVLGAAVVGLLGWSWWRYGRDRRYTTLYYLTDDPSEETRPLFSEDAIVVEYQPPERLRPAQLGLILDETADTLDVTATIVDLAVRGYLHITEVSKEGLLGGVFGGKDWELTRTDKGTGDLLDYEQIILRGLFVQGSPVRISELKYKFHKYLGDAKSSLYRDAMSRKWFARRPDHARAIWATIGSVVLILGGALVFALGAWLGAAIAAIPIAVGGLGLLVLSPWMPKRTAAGREALRRTLGFRQYIATAEKDRQQFNEQQNLFSEYLPYAIVFHCVDKWARAFEDIDVTPSTQYWYTGHGYFGPAAFSRDLQGFSSAVSSTIVSTPGGSGGSGFSGGSAGGGGGGGGGGSW